MEDFGKGKKKNPEVVDIGKARSDIEEKNAQETLSEYDQGHALFNLGLSQYKSQELKKAKENFTKAVEISPSYADAWYNLAVVCEDLGEKGEAIKNYRNTIICDPSYADAHFNLAALLESSSPQEAINHYIQYLEFSEPKDKYRNSARNSINKLNRKLASKKH
jgi:Tfp pilus assembly protein PilF